MNRPAWTRAVPARRQRRPDEHRAARPIENRVAGHAQHVVADAGNTARDLDLQYAVRSLPIPAVDRERAGRLSDLHRAVVEQRSFGDAERASVSDSSVRPCSTPG